MDFQSLTLADLKTAYEAATPAADELRAMLTEIDRTRLFRFKRQDVATIYPTLINDGQLAPDGSTVNGTDLAITDTPIFYYGLYQMLSTRFGFSLSADLTATRAFLDQAETYIYEAKMRAGSTQTMKGFTQWVLYYSVAEFGADLPSFALSYPFNDATAVSAAIMDCLIDKALLALFPIDEVWPVCRRIALEFGEPKPGVLHLSWNHLTDFVRTYCRNTEDPSDRVRELALGDLNTIPVYYICLAAFVGLWDKGDFPLADLLDWLDQPDRQRAALTILKIISLAATTDKQAVLDRMAAASFSTDDGYQLPPVYVHLLNEADPTETVIISTCERQLREALKSSDKHLVVASIVAIRDLKDNLAFWLEEIIALATEGRLEPMYLPWIDDIFVRNPIADKFGAFMAAYASGIEAWTIPNEFDRSLSSIQGEHPAALDQALVKLMTDDRGRVRRAGHHLFYSRFDHGRRASFSFDILTLSELEQTKLVFTVLHPFREVDQTIAPIVSLLRSPYPSVRTFVQQRLVDLTYSFRNQVAEEIESLLAPDLPDCSAIIDLLRSTNDKFLAETEKKIAIPELDPRQTWPKDWRTYMQAYNKRSRNALRLAQQSHLGIAAISKTVPINRGGGWKPHGSDKVLPLNSIHLEVSISRMLFLHPEAMDEQYFDIFSADWQTDFNLWAQKTY